MIKTYILKKFNLLDNIVDSKKLKEYIDYCFAYNIGKKIKGITSLHHILPRAKTLPFEQFSNLKINKWNGVYLQYKHHYIAHYMLAQAIEEHAILYAFVAMHVMDSKNERLTDDILINAEQYQKLKSKSDKLLSINRKGFVNAKNLITGKNSKVIKSVFDSNENLVGITKGTGGKHLKGTISIIDKHGIIKRINKSSYDSTIHKQSMIGKALFKDSAGNIELCSVDDSRVLCGTLVGQNKGNTFNGSKISKIKKEKGDAIGSKNPKATKIALYDSFDNLQAISFGHLKELSSHFGIPQTSLYNTILYNWKLFTSKRMITYAKNRHLEHYVGWYARKINDTKYDELLQTNILKFI